MVQDFQYFQSFLFTNRRSLEYVTDKNKSCASIINYMLARLQKMFKYSNLPSTIPRQYLENYLLVNGSCIIARDKKNPFDKSIYAFIGAAGGEPDIYYRPTKYMVANPSLNFSAEYYISDTDPNHERDAILVRNDTMWQGLYPMMARYASLIAENLLTIRTADVMLRVLALITAPDDSSRLAADQYLKDITEGKLASIGENRFLDGIRMQNPPSNNGSYLTQFIELHQYLVGSFYNEVGLNANYNMKREALSESEAGLNDDSLLPLCEDMLRCRQEDIASVNSLFGTSIEVTFDSSWLENEIERLLSLKEQYASTHPMTSSQLATPAGQEYSDEEDSKEGASQLGASMEDASGKDDDDDGIDESGNGESNKDGTEDGGNDPGSQDGDGLEEVGETDDGSEEEEEGAVEENPIEENPIEEKLDDAINAMIDIMIEDAQEEDDGVFEVDNNIIDSTATNDSSYGSDALEDNVSDEEKEDEDGSED